LVVYSIDLANCWFLPISA